MIQIILIVFFFSAVSAAFSYLLDYALGYPGKKDITEINTKAILFGWTYLLARRRFGITKILALPESYEQEMKLRNIKIGIIAESRELFTWEHSVGMCIFCTNVWVSVIFVMIAYFYYPELYLFTVPLFSHFILRKI